MQNEEIHSDLMKFDALIEKYKPLIVNETNIVFKNNNERIDFDDLRQEATIALLSAARSYDAENEKITFGLYAKICIRNRLVSCVRKFRKSIERLTFPVESSEEEDIIDVAPPPEETLLENERVEELRRIISETFTDYERKVVSLYLADYSYTEIAKAVGKDLKSVDNAITRVKNKIKNAFKL